MFFVLSRAWDKENFLSPLEESNLRTSDSAFRCSTTEPQRLCGERGLLRSSYRLLGSAMSIVSCFRIRKAAPSSMHDACYMNFAIDLAYRRVSVAQWGLRIFSLSHARDKKENIFL